jgi:hypothetical protein
MLMEHLYFRSATAGKEETLTARTNSAILLSLNRVSLELVVYAVEGSSFIYALILQLDRNYCFSTLFLSNMR